jgi:hypothetical protein
MDTLRREHCDAAQKLKKKTVTRLRREYHDTA